MPDISYFILILIAFLTVNYIYLLHIITNGINNLLKQDLSDFNNPTEKISVIVPFRNESENILTCLKSLEGQGYDHNKFEVIFVDDFSEDDSLQKLKQNIKLANIKVIRVPEELKEKSSKKTALNFGINNSSGEIIVTTDADCIHPAEWLSTIIKYYSEDTGIVAGPIQFENGKKIFQRVQSLEFQSLIITGAGLIGASNPIICNAANFSYRKELFLKLNGFGNSINASSGDDVLFMQKVAAETDYKIKFCLDENCIVKTNPSKTIKEFLLQRKRWAGKVFHYPNKLFLLELTLVFLFYLSLILQIFLVIFISKLFLITFLISCFAKVISDLSVLLKGNNALKQKFDWPIFLLAELFHLPYIIFSVLAGLFGSYNWKGRKVVH